MGLRVRKSVKVLPGTRVNISKSGVSTSTRLAKGVSYRTQVVGGKKRKTTTKAAPTGPVVLRWWWFVIAILFIMSAGTTQKTAELASTASTMGVIGLVMLVISIVVIVRRSSARRKAKEIVEPEEFVEPDNDV